MERIKNSHLENQLDLLNDYIESEMFGDNVDIGHFTID